MGRAIRPVALALIRRGDELLVEQGRDEVENETFFRLLGGGIEFGERGSDAVRRELREELGIESDVRHYVGILENIFTYEGEAGHELALVYECSLRDRQVYALDAWEVAERSASGSRPHELVWKPLDAFGAGARLYPDGAVELARERARSPETP